VETVRRFGGRRLCYRPAVLRRRPSLCAFASAFGLALALFVPREAGAFERQWHAGAGLAYAALVNPAGAVLHGFGGGVHLTYGLSDTVNLLVLADATVHPAITYKSEPVEGVVLAGGSVGFSYVFDVLQWVPYLGATAGVYYEAGPTTGGPRLGLQLPFGLDYQLSRSFAIGAAGEYKLLFLDVAGPSQRISAFLRAEYIWGF
jgi:hypothetical protein